MEERCSSGSAGKTRQGWTAAVVIASVLVVDQIVKYLVKTNMFLGEDIRIAEWFHIVFVENNGMAFGMEVFGKLFLSIFRIVAIGAFVWYLCRVIGKGLPTGYVVCISFIIAGAMGNLIDCIVYGQVFTESSYGTDGVAHSVPFGQGYAPMLYGKVVDMFYFPLWRWPEWVPLLGGDVFFNPVFNVADSCITCGMIVLILFYSKYLNTGFRQSSGNNSEDEE